MLIIFLFSSNNKGESDSASSLVLDMFNKIFGTNLNGDEHLFSLFGYNFTSMLILRKLAHMTEYAVLSSLIFFGLWDIKNFKIQYPLAVFISFLYACTDEFHQLFIGGRSGQIKDVLIDTAGAIIGAGLMLIIVKLINTSKEKSSTN